MKKCVLIALGTALLATAPAHAISAKYREQLERSGCTQVTELQGCDITKTKAENAKAMKEGASNANVAAPAGPVATATAAHPYAGEWTAKTSDGSTVATIRIDAKEQVWVNGKHVKAKRSDGALIFKDGFITYTIQGDRRLKGEDTWHDSDAGSSGPIQGK